MKKRNRIVINYDNVDDDLVLLSIRDYNGDININNVEFNNFNKVDEIKMDIDQLVIEKTRPDFINEEGFVLLYSNGFRVKIKYEEYFRIHKTISNVNEKFVWEFLSQGKDINDLNDNIPDETFQFIKDTKDILWSKHVALERESIVLFSEVIDKLSSENPQVETTKWMFAEEVNKPQYKKFRALLFKVWDGKSTSELIWKMIRPKYEKGEGGFQSFKLDN